MACAVVRAHFHFGPPKSYRNRYQYRRWRRSNYQSIPSNPPQPHSNRTDPNRKLVFADAFTHRCCFLQSPTRVWQSPTRVWQVGNLPVFLYNRMAVSPCFRWAHPRAFVSHLLPPISSTAFEKSERQRCPRLPGGKVLRRRRSSVRSCHRLRPCSLAPDSTMPKSLPRDSVQLFLAVANMDVA
jgi:hypothetical protein